MTTQELKKELVEAQKLLTKTNVDMCLDRIPIEEASKIRETLLDKIEELKKQITKRI